MKDSALDLGGVTLLPGAARECLARPPIPLEEAEEDGEGERERPPRRHPRHRAARPPRCSSRETRSSSPHLRVHPTHSRPPSSLILAPRAPAWRPSPPRGEGPHSLSTTTTTKGRRRTEGLRAREAGATGRPPPVVHPSRSTVACVAPPPRQQQRRWPPPSRTLAPSTEAASLLPLPRRSRTAAPAAGAGPVHPATQRRLRRPPLLPLRLPPTRPPHSSTLRPLPRMCSGPARGGSRRPTSGGSSCCST
jgi:hypothetical protein